LYSAIVMYGVENNGEIVVCSCVTFSPFLLADYS